MSDVLHVSTLQGLHQALVFIKKCIQNNTIIFVGKNENEV
jgi:hypothetical protein